MFFIHRSSAEKKKTREWSEVLEMETRRGDIGRARWVHSMWWHLHTCLAICAPSTFDELSAYWQKGCFAGTLMKATPHKDTISSFPSLKVFRFGKYLFVEISGNEFDHTTSDKAGVESGKPDTSNHFCHICNKLSSSVDYSPSVIAAASRINEPLLTKCSYSNKALCFSVIEKELSFLFVPNYDSLIIFTEARLTLQEL